MITWTYCKCHTIIILQICSRGKAKTMSVSTEARCWFEATQWQPPQPLPECLGSGQRERDEPPSPTLAAPRSPRQQSAELTSAVPLSHDAISSGLWLTWLNDSFQAWIHTKIYRYVRLCTINYLCQSWPQVPQMCWVVLLVSPYLLKDWDGKFTRNSSNQSRKKHHQQKNPKQMWFKEMVLWGHI